MVSLVDSVWKEIGSFSGLSALIFKSNHERSVSLINLPSIQFNRRFCSSNGENISDNHDNQTNSNKSKNLSNQSEFKISSNENNQQIGTNGSTDEYIDLIRQIISCYGLRVIHDNPDQNGVLFKENSFVLDSLHWHNILRIKHQAPPLSLSIQLCERAQDWANKLAHWDVFYHQNQPTIGQNLMLKCSSLHEIEVDGEQVTKYWYAEVEHYRFDLPDHLLHTQANQFTQMVWKGSRKFGIGKARSRSGKLIVVANFEPPGNIKEHFLDNVLARFEDFELDFIADNLISNHRGRLNRAYGRKFKTRRKAVYD